jgi:hypothetical protein
MVEGLDIVETRRRLVIAVTVLVAAVGVVVALLFPQFVPPNPLVGAAVGLAAVLLGVAAAVGADATDLRVRGPRHVGAAGGELVAVLPVAVDRSAADELASAVLDAREEGRPLLLGLAASGLDVAATVAWTDALALAVARTGVTVLRVDLASGRTEAPGLSEVEAGERKLTEVVDFEPGLRLARTGVGDDQRGALRALTALPPKLPRDLDVLLVALPMAASRGVVQAARVLDHVLIVAERARTSRVDLIAGLDALDAADLQAQVVLLDDRTASRLAVRADAGEAEAAPPVPEEEQASPEGAEAAAEAVGERPADAAGPAAPDGPAPDEAGTYAVGEPGDLVDPAAGVDDDVPADAAAGVSRAEHQEAALDEPADAVADLTREEPADAGADGTPGTGEGIAPGAVPSHEPFGHHQQVATSEGSDDVPTAHDPSAAASPAVPSPAALPGDIGHADVEPAGAGAAEGGPNSDETAPETGSQPGAGAPLGARDVDVVLGAAAAAAADLANDGLLHPTSVEQDAAGLSSAAPEAEQPSARHDGPTGNDDRDAEDRHAAGWSGPGAEDAQGSTPATGAHHTPDAAEHAPDADDRDATDRLPRVGRRKQTAGDGEDDLLRTTAQLAILLDDLEGRDAP